MSQVSNNSSNSVVYPSDNNNFTKVIENNLVITTNTEASVTTYSSRNLKYQGKNTNVTEVWNNGK